MIAEISDQIVDFFFKALKSMKDLEEEDVGFRRNVVHHLSNDPTSQPISSKYLNRHVICSWVRRIIYYNAACTMKSFLSLRLISQQNSELM